MNALYQDARWLHLPTGDVVPLVVRAGSTLRARPKCLLLHGNPGSLSSWARLLPLLEATVDVAAIDLPGFGRSRRRDPSPAGVALGALSSAALGTLDALGWSEPCFVVGHSHGAAVALTLAATRPPRIAGLVLLSSLGSPAHLGYRLLNLPGALPLARFLSFITRTQDPRSVVQVAQQAPSDVILEAAPRVHCPTLFMHGERDRLVPVPYARNIHARMLAAGGNSSFEIVPGAGHSFFQRHALPVAERIATFLNSGARP